MINPVILIILAVSIIAGGFYFFCFGRNPLETKVNKIMSRMASGYGDKNSREFSKSLSLQLELRKEIQTLPKEARPFLKKYLSAKFLLNRKLALAGLLAHPDEQAVQIVLDAMKVDPENCQMYVSELSEVPEVWVLDRLISLPDKIDSGSRRLISESLRKREKKPEYIHFLLQVVATDKNTWAIQEAVKTLDQFKSLKGILPLWPPLDNDQKMTIVSALPADDECMDPKGRLAILAVSLADQNDDLVLKAFNAIDIEDLGVNTLAPVFKKLLDRDSQRIKAQAEDCLKVLAKLEK